MDKIDYSSIWCSQCYYDRDIPKEKWLSADLTDRMKRVFERFFLSSRLLYSFHIVNTDFLVIEVHLKMMSNRQTKFSDIIHRAMPYPILLVENYNNEWFKLSFVMAHINSGNNARKVVDMHLESPWVKIDEIIGFRCFWESAPFVDLTETNLRHNAFYYFQQMSNDNRIQYFTLKKYYEKFIADYAELPLGQSSICLRLKMISDCFEHCHDEIISDYCDVDEALEYLSPEDLECNQDEIESLINSVNAFSDTLSSVVMEIDADGWFDNVSYGWQEDEGDYYNDYYDYYDQEWDHSNKLARKIYLEYLEDLSRELTAFQYEMSTVDLSKYPMIPLLIEKLSTLIEEVSSL